MLFEYVVIILDNYICVPVCCCKLALNYKDLNECAVYGSKLYIIIIVLSGVGSWMWGLAWLPLLSATPHLS